MTGPDEPPEGFEWWGKPPPRPKPTLFNRAALRRFAILAGPLALGAILAIANHGVTR